MSLRGVVGSQSGLVPGRPFGVVENAAPPQWRPTTGPAASPDTGAPATDWNDRLATARTEEFTDLFQRRTRQGRAGRDPGRCLPPRPHRGRFPGGHEPAHQAPGLHDRGRQQLRRGPHPELTLTTWDSKVRSLRTRESLRRADQLLFRSAIGRVAGQEESEPGR